MPGIVQASCLCPLDHIDPEKRALCSVPTAERARPEHNLICLQRPHCSFLSCCHLRRSEDVTTCLTNRELSHQLTDTNSHTHKVREGFSTLSNVAKGSKLRSQQISCIGIKNYSNSRMRLSVHHPRGRVFVLSSADRGRNVETTHVTPRQY